MNSLKQITSVEKPTDIRASLEKVIHPKKKYQSKVPEVKKVSSVILRIGIEYTDTMGFKERQKQIESGEIEPSGKVSPYTRITKNLYKHTGKGVSYLAGSPSEVEESKKNHEKSKFFIDGEEVFLDDEIVEGVKLQDILYARDCKTSSDKELDWVYLPTNHIVDIEYL